MRGALSSTTIIHALGAQRVLTVTGAAINNSTVITGLTFRDGNTTEFFGGGAIRVQDFAHPLLQNLIITGNQASTTGGGLSVELGSPLRLVNVSFYSNTATLYGGGIYALDALIVEGGVFRNNRCTSLSCLGGGLATGDATYPLSLDSVDFISNSAHANGGGVYALGTLTVQDGSFIDNATDSTGGGLFSFSTAAITGTRFLSNSSAGEGGAAVLQGGGLLQTAFFQDNHCTNVDCSGGAVYVTGSALNVLDTQFISNTAEGYGGGGLVTGAATTIQGGRFQGNASLAPTYAGQTLGGGGLFALDTLALTGTVFTGNQSAGVGGGVLHEAKGGRLVNALFVGNTSAAGGDAFAVDSIVQTTELFVILHATIVAPAGPPGSSAIRVLTGTLGITNSIFSNFAVGVSRPSGTGAVSQDYNLFSGVAVTTTGAVAGGSHSLAGNPAFRNASAGDYHLAFGSAALNAAANAGVPIDADGDSRPIGPGPDMGYDEARLVALSLSKTDGQTNSSQGAALTYTIVVNNAGPSVAAGVVVSDVLPAGLVPGTWTCLASGGSSCPASGNGSINASVTIASGSFVQFTLYVTVAGNASGAIVNTVSAIAPAGLVNTNIANSSASDTTTVGSLKVYLPVVLR
jgi:uncharacterized repeat protein (TIGR01451 family)